MGFQECVDGIQQMWDDIKNQAVDGGYSQAYIDAIDAQVKANVITAQEALDKVNAAYIGQSAASIGYATKADLDADLTPADGVLAIVTNDATATNNGTYRKSGATGTGSWVQSSYDRITVTKNDLEAKISDVKRNISDFGSDISVGTYTDGYYLDKNNGSTVADSNFHYAIYTLTDSEDLFVTADVGGGATALAIYYDSGDNYLGYEESGISGVVTHYTDYRLTIPDGTAKIGISSNNTYSPAIFKKLVPRNVSSELDILNVDHDIVALNKSDIDAIKPNLTGFSEPKSVGAYTDGYYLAKGNGAITANSNFHYVKYPISSTDPIAITATIGGGDTALAIYYDSNDNYLGYEVAGTATNTTYTDYVLALPPETAFIGISSNNSFAPATVRTTIIRDITGELDALNADHNTLISTKSDVDVIKGEIPNLATISDLATPVYTTGNYIQYSNGSLVANDNFHYSKIDVPTDAKEVFVTATVNGGVTALAIYYDINGTYLGYEERGISGVSKYYVDYKLTLPSGTASIGFSSNVVFGEASVKVSKISPLANKVSDYDKVVSSLTELLPTTNTTTQTSGTYYNPTDGLSVSDANYKSTLFFLNGNEGDLYVSATINGANTALAVYYDTLQNYISNEALGVDGSDTVYSNYKLNMPSGTKFIGFSTTATSDEPIVKEYQVIDVPTKLIDMKTYWTGKKVVWFGTSIPALGGDKAYPILTGNLIGANIVNEAVASSMARNGIAVNRDSANGDPYGWKNRAWQNVAWCLSADLSEKQYLIDNWDTVSVDLLINNPPATLTADDKAKILDCSWENKLNRHLGANRADLFVFDHGHNDRYTPDLPELSTIPTDTRDKGYFLGAMAFLIDKILADNPRARICFIGHYEDARKEEISNAQKVLASQWDFPLMKLWEKLGWTQEVVNVDGVDKTITQIWMPVDDLHPGFDPTNEANELIAENLASFLRDVR